MARRQERPQPKSPEALKEEVGDLLALSLSDAELRAELETLAAEPAFSGLTYLWGPAVYNRNRVLFRPLILRRFGTIFRVGWDWTPVRWKKHAAALDPWLEEVDRRDDAALFQRLYAWKHPESEWGRLNQKRWRKDLAARYLAASSRPERARVLDKFDIRGAMLDEATALQLYEADPDAARPFLLKHPLEEQWQEKRKLPEKLGKAAQARGDEALYFTLYRAMAPRKTWEQDIAALARNVADPRQLVEELEKRHPDRGWDFDLASGFYALASARGRDVIPYVMKHLDSAWNAFEFSSRKKKKANLLELARQEHWWDVWSVLVRKQSAEAYNAEVLALVQDRRQPDEAIFRRLVMLSGASHQGNWGRFAWQQIQSLNDKTAVALYGRFPELVHGPFRKHLRLGWWDSEDLPQFTLAALAKDDQPLIDYLASQVVQTACGYNAKRIAKTTDRLQKHFEKLRSDPATFARRVASVLGRLPAYSLGQDYRISVENNTLVRLFFVESVPTLLEDGGAVRDLLEAPEIHTQILALRVLRQDDERARRLAVENLDLLLTTPLRAMHRKSRIIALEALANAATTEANARRILASAKQALDLPDKGYPKERLLSLIADLLQRWPELRGPREQPVVFHARPKQKTWA